MILGQLKAAEQIGDLGVVNESPCPCVELYLRRAEAIPEMIREFGSTYKKVTGQRRGEIGLL